MSETLHWCLCLGRNITWKFARFSYITSDYQIPKPQHVQQGRPIAAVAIGVVAVREPSCTGNMVTEVERDSCSSRPSHATRDTKYLRCQIARNESNHTPTI